MKLLTPSRIKMTFWTIISQLFVSWYLASSSCLVQFLDEISAVGTWEKSLGSVIKIFNFHMGTHRERQTCSRPFLENLNLFGTKNVMQINTPIRINRDCESLAQDNTFNPTSDLFLLVNRLKEKHYSSTINDRHMNLFSRAKFPNEKKGHSYLDSQLFHSIFYNFEFRNGQIV